jgi:hypothetical protein
MEIDRINDNRFKTSVGFNSMQHDEVAGIIVNILRLTDASMIEMRQLISQFNDSNNAISDKVCSMLC